ncbi:MAG TPA: CtsR family transcriptional regulator [Patescibacteria group bacterium]|nr:CtsR family transcriptional regulator [Patescibacteria group bacterium]
MDNLADVIEKWILSKLSRQQDEMVVLRRNEMATELSCAPSQISYVLSTRFTVERGFFVESRRGLGGFVRIVRLPVRRLNQEEAARVVSPDASVGEVLAAIKHLKDRQIISGREAALMSYFFSALESCMTPAERVMLLRKALLAMASAH